jgi:hypothetical protein
LATNQSLAFPGASSVVNGLYFGCGKCSVVNGDLINHALEAETGSRVFADKKKIGRGLARWSGAI